MGEVTPFYRDDWLSVFHGDCREVMASLPAESVHCVVTSPPLGPYWGLRDYGTATWVGGTDDCDHSRPNARMAHERRASTLGGGVATVAAQDAGANAESVCGRCGATRQDSQLGLEPTPEEYVANLVAVFREVRRVLRKDGTVWLNLGDSYASHDPGERRDGEFLNPNGVQYDKGRKSGPSPRNRAGNYRPGGLKPKDLVGIPWRAAFALQADGWYLRSDIIWAKPNPMPESVTDRPTKSHEYIFLLSKSARYYFDADAVREEWADDRLGNPGNYRNGYSDGAGRNDGPTKGLAWLKGAERGGRNIRSVWTMATQPYPGAHFATFPEQLPERCIKAGTSEKGVCPECGAPWQRVVERQNESTYARIQRETGTTYRDMKAEAEANGITPGNVGGTHAPGRRGAFLESPDNLTTGWQPSCAHAHEPIPATVLDPFAGSGTTGMVAQSLSRRAVLIDLSLDYLGQLMARNADIPLGLGA